MIPTYYALALTMPTAKQGFVAEDGDTGRNPQLLI
jgi:hypothetical protein